jgi:hypothetical protein
MWHVPIRAAAMPRRDHLDKTIEVHGGPIWTEVASPERGTAFIVTWKEDPR